MEYNEIAAKRRKKRKNSIIYAPFVHFRGNSPLPVCSLRCKAGAPCARTKMQRNRRVTIFLSIWGLTKIRTYG
jgi:hypothetical protein